MSDQERIEFDADPLWSEEGQISWLLEHRDDGDDFLSAGDIAVRLRIGQPVVAAALDRMEIAGTVGAFREGRRTTWGSRAQAMARRAHQQQAERDAAAARRAVAESNAALAETAKVLRGICAEQAVEVSIFDPAWRDSDSTRGHTLVIAVQDAQAAGWLAGRLRVPAPDEGAPTEAEWADYSEVLDRLLAAFDWAGWIVDEGDYWFSEYERNSGPVIHTVMRRTCMALAVEFRAADLVLLITPHAPMDEAWPLIFGMQIDDVRIDLPVDADEQVRVVAERAGELGLLDATRVDLDMMGREARGRFIDHLHVEWIFEVAAQHRGLPVEQLIAELIDDDYLQTYFRFVVGFAGRDALPDAVPDAAALGIAAWCWRNDTAVEEWHVAGDVLMARINIAVTRLAADHVDPWEGVDWLGIAETVSATEWALPDGRIIAELFGDGWPDVRDSVLERIHRWRQLDEEKLGPQATLRLLAIGGSTSYTRHWWGQGRWTAICRAIVFDAVRAGVVLPAHYHELGPDQLVSDLAAPDLLSDVVLEWLIDMPAGGIDGPRGLRFHDATQPVVRTLHPLDQQLFMQLAD
ncbi:hypothetical protein ACVGOW_13440 [Pseudonocardia saturnea]